VPFPAERATVIVLVISPSLPDTTSRLNVDKRFVNVWQ
jgi:hypothetical protein